VVNFQNLAKNLTKLFSCVAFVDRSSQRFEFLIQLILASRSEEAQMKELGRRFADMAFLRIAPRIVPTRTLCESRRGSDVRFADELTRKLAATGYFIDPVMTQVVFLAAKLQKPLLLERPAGSGKTSTAAFAS